VPPPRTAINAGRFIGCNYPYVAHYYESFQVAHYIGYNPIMVEVKLTHTATMILQAIEAGCVYGLSIMEATGLPSGTVYPAMRRLEASDLIRSAWESQRIADAEQRPARKYHKLTAAGKARLQTAQKRYPLLASLKKGATREP
jgi:PadR family transcriptional regulator, regulatory protein PadR